MSWQITVPPTTHSELDAAIDGAQASYDGQPIDPSQHVAEQIEVAKAAAKAIVRSGAAGSTDRAYEVSLSGHANPGHAPIIAEGEVHATDGVSVTVHQAQPTEVVDAIKAREAAQIEERAAEAAAERERDEANEAAELAPE